MNRLLLLLSCCICIYSCGGKVDKREETPTAATESPKAEIDSSAHLPVDGFLRDDMRKVEIYAGGILRKATTGKRKDSTFLEMEQFQRRAQQFLLKELDSAYFQSKFSQTSLVDESTGLITFIYTPNDSTSSLQKVMVYVAPTGMSTDNVDRIYMETAANQGDTLVEKRLSWKMRQYFYVLTLKQPKTGNPITTMEKVIWDPQHFGDQ
jgi:hypothetical protein